MAGGGGDLVWGAGGGGEVVGGATCASGVVTGDQSEAGSLGNINESMTLKGEVVGCR